MVRPDDEEDDDPHDDLDSDVARLVGPVAEVLREADRMFLLRLDPHRRRSRDQPPGRHFFHSWRVTRRIILRDPSDRGAVVLAIERGLARSDGDGDDCFDPTIGVRARRGDDRVDLMCCFDCEWLEIVAVINGQRSWRQVPMAGSERETFSALTDRPKGS
jgi:hypothetical protein